MRIYIRLSAKKEMVRRKEREREKEKERKEF